MAEHAVEGLLLSYGWTVRRDFPDDGIDFNVEVPGKGNRPTFRFLVQVKSSETMRVRRDGTWPVRVLRQRFKEYRSHRLPVFVIARSVSTDLTRWADVHDPTIIHRETSSRKGKIVHLHIPAANALGDEGKDVFLAALYKAVDALDARYTSPVAALEYRAQTLALADSRFVVEGSIQGGREVYEISARDQPVDVSIEMLVSNQHSATLSDAIAFGLPGAIPVIELNVIGSPIFDEFSGKPGTVVFGATPTTRRMLIGCSTDMQNLAAAEWHLEEDAAFHKGTSGVDWRLNCAALPLQIQLRIDPVKDQVSFSIRFDTDAWLEQAIIELPYFEALLNFYDRLVTSCGLAIGFRLHGKPYHLCTVPISENRDFLLRQWRLLQCIDGLIDACKWANRITIRWQSWSDVLESETKDWIEARALLEGKGLVFNVGPITAAADRDSPADKFVSAPGTLMMVRTGQEVRAWGHLVANIPIIIGVRLDRIERIDDAQIRIVPKANSRAFAVLDPAISNSTMSLEQVFETVFARPEMQDGESETN